MLQAVIVRTVGGSAMGRGYIILLSLMYLGIVRHVPPTVIARCHRQVCDLLREDEGQENEWRNHNIAIYHLEAKVISRGVGRSAVAASAYMSCSRMLNDYDGVQHDYTKKQGLIWQQVFLPPMAPPEWSDREKLWNAVEENEKTKDSRLAREFVVALPIELDKDEQIALISDFIRRQFVSDGMCADVAIHDTDGHNPHAHIMLTVRPLNANGTWQHKTEKEYLCVKDSEERGFTAAEYKEAQRDGWEKQYSYWISKKEKEYMTPSAAEARGLERASKYAKSTKYGRQNPISACWNSDEQLLVWRKAWADAVNLTLEHKGLDERIDHRSHAERGIDEQPTIHEGVAARAMEAKGFISDCCELNRQIKADNARLRVLREIVEKLTAVFENTATGIAAALEAARERIIISTYGIRHTINRLSKMKPSIERRIQLKQQYDNVHKIIRTKAKERKKLQAEKKALSPIHVKRHLELASSIAGLTEEIEELRSEKNRILTRARCADDVAMRAFSAKLDQSRRDYNALIERKTALTAERQDSIAQYEETYEKIQPGDEEAVKAERQRLRAESENGISETFSEIYGKFFDPNLLSNATKETDLDLAFDHRAEKHRKDLYMHQSIEQKERNYEPR